MSNFFLLTLLFLIGCSNNNKNEKPSKTTSSSAPTFQIQPIGNFSQKEILILASSLNKVYPKIEILPTIPFPENTFYKKNNRYRADSLINFLAQNTKGNKVAVGITDKDISVTKNEHQDWGVMGLGYLPGNACIASTFRLKKPNKTAHLYKVVIHELGHTQGLPHCANNSCFMVDAEGGYPLKQEVSFCESCNKFLRDKGWKLPIPCLGG